LEAVRATTTHLSRGMTEVVDVDLEKFLDHAS
jgi:hypothetical protein